MLKQLYSVYVDGLFVGMVEEEDYVWDLAQTNINGFSKLLIDDDIADRVEYYKIDINRFYNDGRFVYDKLKPPIDCNVAYDGINAEEIAEKLNEINLEKERVEARMRAMAL